MTITTQQLKDALPAPLKTFATAELAQKIDAVAKDPLVADQIKENFIGYTHILREGNFKMESYLNAVMYVSFKLMGYSNRDAYIRTFPDRYSQMLVVGRTDKEIDAYVCAYHRGKLVNRIMEQSMIPSWVLNQDAYQEAINKSIQLMRTAKSEKVQAMAADMLLKYLSKPESKDAPLINIDMRENSGLEELKGAITSLAQKQKELIQNGLATKVIAEQNIYEPAD